MYSDVSIPKPGERYRHFKGGLYQVITVAKHTESGENLVIYQALYGDFKCYARPLEMFNGNNDKGIKRFVKEGTPAADVLDNNSQPAKDSNTTGDNEILFMILDAPTMKEKLSLIRENRDRFDAKMLGNLAVALDQVVESDDMDEQYDQIIQYLETRTRFETDRLR